MGSKASTVKLDKQTIEAADRLRKMTEGKSRPSTISFAVHLATMVVMWGEARDKGKTAQSLEDFLALATTALRYEFGPR